MRLHLEFELQYIIFFHNIWKKRSVEFRQGFNNNNLEYLVTTCLSHVDCMYMETKNFKMLENYLRTLVLS